MVRTNKDARQKYNSTGIGIRKRPTPLAPYSVVQLDGHKIDMLYTVPVINKHGEIILMTATRMWIIAVIDVATRVIIGYSITSNENYNQSDVLQAIRNSIMPKEKLNFTIGNFTYPENGGFPTLAIPEIEWAMFNTIMLDNAKAHLAVNVIEKLCNNLMCSLNFGSVATPETRGIIERVFQTIEENGFHRLPSTTGSNTRDSRRVNAEKDAIKYRISFDDIKQLTEYFITIYNNSPHSSLDNQTPLQCMKRRIVEAGMKPFIANEVYKENVYTLTNKTEIKTVRGNANTGKRPYITFKGSEYRNDILSASMGLIGQKIIIEINPDNIRTINAYFSDGTTLGILTASGEWGRKNHSLKTREEILKYANQNKCKENKFYAPLTEYENELKERALTVRSSRTKAARMQREQEEIDKQINHTNNTSSNNTPSLNSNDNKDDIERIRIDEAYTFDEIRNLLDSDSVEDAFRKGLI